MRQDFTVAVANIVREVVGVEVDPVGSEEHYRAFEASWLSGLCASSTLARRLHLWADTVSKVHGHYILASDLRHRNVVAADLRLSLSSLV